MEGVEVKKGNHAPRYCKTCEHYKPPRAHHCRQCKTCIVNHCPWIANCVGFHNQGHFLRFLLWVDLATSYHLIMVAGRVMSVAHSYHEEPTLSDILFLVFNFAACVPVWLCVGMFSMYHVYLACGNSTTIEGWEKDKVATLVRRGKIKEIKYPYNIGIIENIKSVLGPNPLLWLWPQKMRGDGLSFPVNPEAGDSDVQYSWPPQDPSRLPNPRPLPSGASAFVYGNEGFNPALRPSNSAMRSRHSHTPPAEAHGFELEQSNGHDHGAGYSSGEDRDYGSTYSRSTTSSPEIYLSDYDEDGEGPMGAGERLPRVRRGSEGWEVRPKRPPWDTSPEIANYPNVDVEGGHVEQGQGGWRRDRPWEEEGRYNYYVPEGDQPRSAG
ncbi:palmitoyltransferase PFA4 [Kwoniella heveanensis BCC8398]|uniref:Palmitoyltransferase n=1 Tax=Kwoniella heveanensis BCC8398 TaxID=1296120 RepID=A0A1B9GZI0_9TREE|nr:palmitoyltransferase PFA4 [Kwoniella heveanensis BCC8398]